MKSQKPLRPDTVIAHAGSHPEHQHGIVNPPVYHASTVLFPTVQALESAASSPLEGTYYGRHGTPTTRAFEQAVAAVEGGDRCVAVCSGMAAIAATLLSLLKQGDHLLMVDSVYAPTRKLCDHTLASFGISTTYYDPLMGSDIATLIRPETRVLFTESPGSMTFEVQDIPALSEIAHRHDILVVMDNTWGAGRFFQAFQHGVDISLQAATKYVVGHSDAMMGTITCRNDLYDKLKLCIVGLGYCAAPDDCYLGLRGLRTLAARLDRHQASALKVAEWLAQRPEVAKVLHPALADCPGHQLWKRDFSGASGLFSVMLRPASKQAIAAMLDGLRLFGMGFSWGGFESLALPVEPSAIRSARPWQAEGPLLRLHIGLEDPDDLIEDLAEGFSRLNRGA